MSNVRAGFTMAMGALLGLAACGGTVVGTGSSGSGGSTGNGTGGGGLAPGACLDFTMCMNPGEDCYAPGEPLGCGACSQAPECSIDADCTTSGPSFICTDPPDSCTCPPMFKSQVCVQGCTSNADCGEGETCRPDHRCAPQACTSSAGCPVNFDCMGGMCQRRSCQVGQPVCDGYCVMFGCYSTPGMCFVVPA
jgi:Cys-rich repeat protein